MRALSAFFFSSFFVALFVALGCQHMHIFCAEHMHGLLENDLHRSHFGSRYTLGCCGHAGLFCLERTEKEVLHQEVAMSKDMGVAAGVG